jgi:hypothetical protein
MKSTDKTFSQLKINFVDYVCEIEGVLGFWGFGVYGLG